MLVFFSITILIFNQKIFLDQNGGFIICNIVPDSKCLTVASIWMTMIQTSFGFFSIRKLYSVGILTWFLKFKKTREVAMPEKKNALKVILDFSENLGLTDIWRLLNPESGTCS